MVEFSRNCPNCGAGLASSDSYFCTRCGGRLPDDLVAVNPSSIKVKEYPFRNQKAPVVLDPRRVRKILTVGILVCSGLAALAFLLLLQRAVKNKKLVLGLSAVDDRIEMIDWNLAGGQEASVVFEKL